jgi:hypothetical protein
MAEAVGVAAAELRRIRPDELLAHERGQQWRQRLAVCERLDDTLVEDIALDRAALEHARSTGSSWSRRAASSAWIVGGTLISPCPEARTRASISSMKSGFPRRQ